MAHEEDELLVDKYMRYQTRCIPNQPLALDPVGNCRSIKCKRKAICEIRRATDEENVCEQSDFVADAEEQAFELSDQLYQKPVMCT